MRVVRRFTSGRGDGVRKAFFLAVLAIAAVGAMALAGAGSAAKPSKGVSTAVPRVAGSHIGVGAVRQVGVRNYAGPNCPGAGWNCTTATRVLQIATAGGDNVAQCTGGTLNTTAGQKCTIEQHGANNTARCFERINAPDTSQLCDITQTGAKNTAIVDQQIISTNNSGEFGDQTATVRQGSLAAGSSALNSVQLSQSVMQNSGGEGNAPSGDVQEQEGYQTAAVTQYASGSGNNESQIDQSEAQFAHGASMQLQNMVPNGTDCAPSVGSIGPNICANVFQKAVNGNNTNRLNQSLDQKAKSNSDGADQWQGTHDGGIDGQVHQATDPSGPGSSSNTANESKTQDESAPSGATQTQIDPMSCCGFASQFGSDRATETINQTVNEHASEAAADQSVDLEGTSNSLGTCTFNQHATINIDSASQNASVGPPCPYQGASIECASVIILSPIGDFIGDVVVAQQVGGGCSVFPPENQG